MMISFSVSNAGFFVSLIPVTVEATKDFLCLLSPRAPAMALHQPWLSTSSSSVENLSLFLRHQQFIYRPTITTSTAACGAALFICHRRKRTRGLVFVGKEETELRVSESDSDTQVEEQKDPTPDDLEYVGQIQRVIELLKKNRDMLFSEVKLTVMIEDPREVERRRLLGIEDGPTRDDLVAVLEDVNEGRIPKNRVALQILAEEMTNWPNLEVEVSKKKHSKSLYAKVTDTGVDPKVAAKKLNIDWDSAAEIEDSDVSDDSEVPPVVGYGALYLVSAFPVIIGVSVVLILFYNSLQ